MTTIQLYSFQLQCSFRSLLCAAALAVCGPALADEPVPVSADAVRAELESVLEEAVRGAGARGASAAVLLPGGEVVKATFGFADSETREPLQASDRMLGGSTGKTFVAATAMSLVQDGVLELDVPVSRWLGDEAWYTRLPNHEELTLRMLLNHTGGLPDHIYQRDFRLGLLRERFGDENFHYQPAELVEFILDLPPLAPAGKQFNYSDTGYILAGLVIEAATGRSYYRELQDRILTPLELGEVSPAVGMQIDGLVPGYVSWGFFNLLSGIAGKNLEDGRLNLNPAIEWTGGGLVTTPASLVRFYGALFEGAFLTAESVEQMITSTAVNEAGQPYGLGVFVLENEEFGRYFHHSGWYPGYLTNVIWYEDLGIGVALQYNQDYNADIYEPVKKIARRVRPLVTAREGG